MGEAESESIKARAQADSDKVIAEAKAEAQRITGNAQTELRMEQMRRIELAIRDARGVLDDKELLKDYIALMRAMFLDDRPHKRSNKDGKDKKDNEDDDSEE